MRSKIGPKPADPNTVSAAQSHMIPGLITPHLDIITSMFTQEMMHMEARLFVPTAGRVFIVRQQMRATKPLVESASIPPSKKTPSSFHLGEAPPDRLDL